MSVFSQLEEQIALASNGAPLVAGNIKKKSQTFRDPDYRLDTPGFPEVDTGIFIADAGSKNAGQVYFDCRRIDSKTGKRFKLLRLDKDFYASLMAHATLAEKLSIDPGVSSSDQAQYGRVANAIAEIILGQIRPDGGKQTQKQPQVLSALAGSTDA